MEPRVKAASNSPALQTIFSPQKDRRGGQSPEGDSPVGAPQLACCALSNNPRLPNYLFDPLVVAPTTSYLVRVEPHDLVVKGYRFATEGVHFTALPPLGWHFHRGGGHSKITPGHRRP